MKFKPTDVLVSKESRGVVVEVLDRCYDIYGKPLEDIYLVKYYANPQITATFMIKGDEFDLVNQPLPTTSKLHAVNERPSRRDFVAIWVYNDKMFCDSFFYNPLEQQYYVYNRETDTFIPECDTGYSDRFFQLRHGKITYFIKDEQ